MLYECAVMIQNYCDEDFSIKKRNFSTVQKENILSFSHPYIQAYYLPYAFIDQSYRLTKHKHVYILYQYMERKHSEIA